MTTTIAPGTIADHLSGELDPRAVTRVEGDLIWLDTPVGEIGPFPAENYEFYTRNP